ncbi:carbamoyl phosphate synthase small subunit [candidate division WOR-1 bacterium RIFOXYA12_FULL_43_27]|uniref:Carbamoyl phosphate synthase small chain n=1 Tax=candidate division WOR-1 bacterium RIFOXYC2_FULL_46_14 TaxID=1802587 RepID=A0A1F4U7R1_UNCSA|nr:MAG: carbamoyl phosphate synthase small subunit [candidate division WOR-1 bacterium RIFOXYA12_FULL_43_27]OGC19327.1 MAG: carbamoyl phosphate synthase small subunit [candidate division WOR-1 bacterium RIFOXYB2_FULL_46_45]OGC30316.1 MAG: carbamoyl phosphate synthase small subunit [candidate division WOR-1 bacterium RIFOXYA2_FULL_46_56]OGC40917.1 MAG: carbamoyl phosphate synthase small subunit [candidate division WOR-1 bacterium RIFOXYC2_FULL_46_14]
MKKAILALEDGTIFSGWSFGAEGEKSGEVVFNTSLTGYQEILTDPSYKGQIVTMTYPLIGNYGVNDEDIESPVPQVEAFVVRENSQVASNFRATQKLDRYLKKHKIVGIEGIDTRMLTRKLRINGSLKGIISTVESDGKKLVKKARESRGVEGVDLVKIVTCKKPYRFNNKGKYKVAVYDYGVKLNILRNLEKAGCAVTVYPADYPAEKLLQAKPDGILLSNGPADPAAVTYAIENIKKLIGKLPIFGICLGNQLLGLALGGKTYKLKFGHHGGNQPVMELATKKVEITAQNHGFAVDMSTLSKEEIELTHINLNDRTAEGMAHKKFPIFSVQHHPEAGPGPHDAVHLFERFTRMMEDAKKN